MARPASGAERTVRRERVEGLMIAGASVRQIAMMLDVAPMTVQADMKAIRRGWKERHAAEYDSYVHQELATLGAMQVAMMPKARNGDRLAIDRVLSIMDHRAKLLGLYAPPKRVVDYYPHDAFLEDVAALERQIAEKEAALADEPQE